MSTKGTHYLRIPLDSATIAGLREAATAIAAARNRRNADLGRAGYDWDAESILRCALKNGLRELVERYGVEVNID